MTFGYIARNANNNIMVSDRTYNTVFIGKASFVKSYTGGSNIYIYPNGADITQAGYVHEFTINSGGRKVMPFLHSPSNYYVSILNIKYSGNTCILQVLTQANQQPTVYCFAKANSVPGTGWGMNVFDSAGNITFTTESNMLIIDSVYNAVTPASSLYYTDYRRKNSITVGTAAPVTYTSPFNSSGNAVSKPAIFYSSYATAAVYRSSNGDGYYFESGAKFVPSTKQLQTWWLDLMFFTTINAGVSARDEIALVIDGALYD